MPETRRNKNSKSKKLKHPAGDGLTVTMQLLGKYVAFRILGDEIDWNKKETNSTIEITILDAYRKLKNEAVKTQKK